MKYGTASLWSFGLLMLPGTALAAWGENWGEMAWGLSVSVPSLPGIGLIVLALSLSATAAWRLRKRRSALGLPVLLVLLAIPLVVVAGTVNVPNTFVNGTAADADEINANFDSVETAVNDNDTRIGTALSNAAAAQITADSAQNNVLAEGSARTNADGILTSNIVAEGIARSTTDTTLEVSIAAEGIARSSADSALDGRVTSLEANTLPITTGGSGVTLQDHLEVTGNLSSIGSNGGIITARRGVGTIVIDPTDVSSGYTATLSLDDEGIKLGHNSGARDIQFQTASTTRMTLSKDGDLDVANDITFGPDDTSLTAALASAGDGVQEINQTCAVSTGCFSGDAAGLPVTIIAAGSYRLTSNLNVPDENTDGIRVSANDISIDLNGFAIIGPVTCSGTPLSCSLSGSGTGVERVGWSNRGTSVKNGSISGMGYEGLSLGHQAEVTNLRVHWNRYRGIHAEHGSTVSGNTVYENGSYAISTEAGSTVSGNTAYGNRIGIYAGSGSTVSGNTAYGNEAAGFYVSAGSTVSDNTAYGNGYFGFDLSSGTGYRDNVVTNNTGGTINGGVNAGGNVCNGSTTCP